VPIFLDETDRSPFYDLRSRGIVLVCFMTFLGGWAANHVQPIMAFFLTKQGLTDLPEQQNLLVPSGE